MRKFKCILTDVLAIRELVKALNDMPTAEGRTREALSLAIRKMSEALIRKYTMVVREGGENNANS